MRRILILSFVFCFAGCAFGSGSFLMAQSNGAASSGPAGNGAASNGSVSNQHAEESAENAWLEMMPAPMPPPLRSVSAPAPRQQDPVRSVRISGGVMAAQVLTRVDPVYPPEARTGHMEGSVVLSAKIGTDGTVQDLQAISGPQPLRDSALAAVRQWTYKPYMLNGNPVTVLTTVTVNYHL